jgi:hypothetical protein
MAVKIPLEKTNLCFPEQNKLSCNPIFLCHSTSLLSRRKIGFKERFALEDLHELSKQPLSKRSNKNNKILLTRFWENQYLGNSIEQETIVLDEVEKLLNPHQENKAHKFKQITSLRRTNSCRVEAAQIEKTFFELANQWRRETNHMSIMSDIILHPAYQRIIGMGLDVVPLILRELSKEPDHWFWALRSITGANPVKSEDKGRLKKMAEAWLDWGRQHGYKC